MDVNAQGAHVVDALRWVELHFRRNVSGADGDLAHLAGVGAEDKLGGRVQHAHQCGQCVTSQLGDCVLLAGVLGILLVDEPQRNLGEFEFANECLADVGELCGRCMDLG